MLCALLKSDKKYVFVYIILFILPVVGYLNMYIK